jgi:hypothetical protein
MAKKDSDNSTSFTNSSGMEARRFDKNLQKDTNDYHVQDNEWTYARNAINNSNIGDLGRLGNEPANKLCLKVWQNPAPTPSDPWAGTGPLTIIGFIHLEKDKWAVFSTDNVNSEVGYFEEEICRYTRIVNDPCLSFKTTNLIYGQSREAFDCNYTLYWADGLNPDRYLKIGDVRQAPYMQPWPGVPYICDDVAPTPVCSLEPGAPTTGCVVCEPIFPLVLDCRKTRLETLMKPICLRVSKDAQGGELLNGSYFATAAYTVNGQRVTDYFTPSNVQPLFDHSGTGGSIRIQIYDADSDNFDEFELVVISVIAQQTVATRIGTYSTRQQEVTLDIITNELPSVPIEQIPVSNVIYEKSDSIYRVNNYLLRIGPTSKFEFNYQPLANQIRTKWVSVEYPEDYYIKGGNNSGYMRDEVYSFFIRWIYDTGDRSASFHIPGRPAFENVELDNGVFINAGTDDNIEIELGIQSPVPLWMVENTAQLTSNNVNFNEYVLCDGGVVIAEGLMGYWESTERYPDNKPEIWNASAHEWSCLNPPDCAPPPQPYASTPFRPSDYDLCARPIRHHRFPDNDLDPSVSHFRPKSQPPSQFSGTSLNHIRVMGVKFENIRPPVDNYGVAIPGIIAFEILRGSRKGNKSVIAKGIINNMFSYNLQLRENTGNLVGLYQNYPYNDLQPDPFISKSKTRTDGFNVDVPLNWEPNDEIQDTLFSFHSPETNFSNPYLSSVELKLYQDLSGVADIRYQKPSRHPKNVLLKDFAAILAVIAGLGAAVIATTGKKKKKGPSGGVTVSNASGTAVAGFSNSIPNPYALVAAGIAIGLKTGEQGAQLGYETAGGRLFTEAIAGLGSNKIVSFRQLLSYFNSVGAATAVNSVLGSYNMEYESEDGASDATPTALTILTAAASGFSGGLPTFLYYVSEGAEVAWRAIYAFARPTQKALQALSHCNYNEYASRPVGQRRRVISDQAYIDNQIHSFSTNYRINNLYRGRFVALQLTQSLQAPFNNSSFDQTRQKTRIKDLRSDYGIGVYSDPEISFNRDSSTYYVAIKQRLRNQYGQIPSISQIPISCTIDICMPPRFNRYASYRLLWDESGNPENRTASSERNGVPGLLSNCVNNIIRDFDFSTSSAIGNVGSASPWFSDESNFWKPSVVNSQTVAQNNGTVTPSDQNTLLYQNFQSPPGTAVVLQSNQTYNFSFDLVEFPTGPDDDYELNVYLGTVAPTNRIMQITSASIGSNTLPLTFSSPSAALTPAFPPLDKLVFESIATRPPFVTTVQFKSEDYSDLDDFYFNIEWGNVQNDVHNIINAGQYFATAVPVTLLTPNFYTGNKKPENYITNLVCPTDINIHLSINARKTNFGSIGSKLVAGLYKLYSGMPNGSVGTLVGVIIPTQSPVFTTNYQNTVTFSIPNPLPTDRYYVLIETDNLTWTVEGYDVTVESCFTQYPVSVTNVCLQGNTQVGVAGCMDPDAVNYDPTATINADCLYEGCTDPDAINYDPNATQPCGTYQGVFPTNQCCEYIATPPGGGVPITSNGVGPCNWNCNDVIENVGSATCGIITDTYRSYPLFGGDIYVGRYTEKNTFFYFNDWMYGQPDRTEWDYYGYRMIPFPTYWFNSEALSIGSIVNSFWSFLTSFNYTPSGLSTLEYPSKYHVLDRPDFQLGLAIKLGYIYLFNSGVRDFFVESEYNVDLRDFGDDYSQRHYESRGRNAFTSLSDLFESGLIRSGNYYKYDTSLSIAKMWYSYVNWGSVYPPYYDPNVSETCYQYRPERILYSLPVDIETVRDNWRIYLTNNYKDFVSRPIIVKQVNKSGALILFESDSPVMFQGTDQLQTDLGTKLTIGDGGLFSQPMQTIMNADPQMEYGSCQNKLSVVNTPVGTFWISQNQGKIYQMSSGLEEISIKNVKWWLAQFLPYQLVKYFPDYLLTDNPVAGIGCQTTYDNINNIVYFSKKDYKPVLDGQGKPLVYYDIDENAFYTLGPVKVKKLLTDTNYFEDASWTISYDVKIKSWVSFHDWHPYLSSPLKTTFMTTQGNSAWIHNQRCDRYVNYYGKNYPFEVEYMVNTIQTVNTLRSIEYQLEVYRYNQENCYDRFHVLDYNFDEAVVYNTEQCSGKLKLFLTPKNNAPLIITYPQVNPNSIDILYSKEENKYRFNQFWDITRDRAEFSWSINDDPAVPGTFQDPNDPTLAYQGGTGQPGSFRQQTIWNTQPNGYVRNLNPFNLNYNKSQLQRKKFRHYTTSVVLRRKISGDKKMLVSIANNKNLMSPR